MEKNIKLALFSLISGMLIGGFIFGFTHCSDVNCSIPGRIIIGIVYLILTPLFAGFPPINEGGTGSFNLWFYIIPIGIITFIYLKRKYNKS